MSHLDPDVLPLVALGEHVLSDDQTAHLASCPTCSGEVEALRHTADIGRSSLLIDTLEAPPQRVWNAISGELGFDPSVVPDPSSPDSSSPVTETSGGADASIAESVAIPHTPRDRTRARPRRWTRAVFALAATVALVVVVGGVWAVSSLPTTQPIASAELLAFPDHPGAHGEAVVEERGDERFVVVTLDAALIPGTFREVWLISADATRLVSLGTLDSESGTFPVPADVDLAEFVLVDISAEPDDGAPEHSGDSIVRGELQST